ncbi:hypothetical protein NFI96_004561 [Prochilodus magdalenae]|nr:hypothetical protein NFI96_004561 [Prochilodus magdalenae]
MLYPRDERSVCPVSYRVPPVKSKNLMMDSDHSSSREGTSDSKLQTYRAEPPEPSCVSMKSSNSMHQPPEFSNERSSTDLRLQTYRAEPPEPSCVSMKSSNSMHQPPEFSNERSSTDLSCKEDVPFQDQSRCGVCEQIQTDPVSINCGHTFCRQCINSYWDQFAQSGDFACPLCRKRTKTRPVLHPHIEESMKQDYCRQVDDVLHRVIQRHKASMKKRYKSLFEGFKAHQNKTLLNRIYAQLCILEGESEGVNEEHEVLQIEKKPWNQHWQDTPINCLNIFKPVQCSVEEMEEDNIRALITEDDRHEERTEDNSPQVQKLRSVMTKGIAGIGKTVSVQKFILDWAEGKANQDVDLMFVFQFRELNLIKDHQYSLQGLLCDFHPELKDLDTKTYDECKMVFIFDGLDESRIPLNFLQCEKVTDITKVSSVDLLMTNLIKGQLLPSALIWITSRPAAANQIPSRYINRVTEIQGFNDPQKEEYFRKRISDQDQADSIISHIKKTRSLHIMCHIPVFCWISATVFQHIMKQGHTEIPKTLTAMYSYFLWTQTIMKSEKYEDRGKTDPEDLLGSNRKILLKLAELAFKQLMKGNVVFYEEDLRECSIDVPEASVYSGICTEIFREESVLHQRNVYCFVHLSFQEFLAALFVFHCYVSKNRKGLKLLISWNTMWPYSDSLGELLRGAVCKALQSENGHLDLFLRFLLGISLESNQQLLKDLLTQTVSSSESIKKTVQYIKYTIETEDLPSDRSINLLLCLTEMNDQSLSSSVQQYLKSEKSSEKELSPAECSALAYMLVTSEEVLDELNLRNYRTSERGYLRLIPAVSNCRKAILADCKLTMNSFETLCAALRSTNSSLKELDLSNTVTQDSGVKLLSAGLKSSNCKLEILRIPFCKIGKKSCEHLVSALLVNSSLKELYFSNNDLQDSGEDLLSAVLKGPHSKLEILRLQSCNIRRTYCENTGSALHVVNSSLKELDLRNNDLQDLGAELISAVLKSPHCKLEILRLQSCNIRRTHCENPGSALHVVNSSLKELDLCNNDLQDLGAELISAVLKSPQCKLEILRLQYCNIGRKSCENHGSAVHVVNSSLTELDLSNNDLQDSGAELLSAVLKSPQCKLEILRQSQVGSRGQVDRVNWFSQKSWMGVQYHRLVIFWWQGCAIELLICVVMCIRLSGCMVTEESCSYLASALSENSSHLKELDLSYNYPGDTGVKLLSARLKDPHCRLTTFRTLEMNWDSQAAGPVDVLQVWKFAAYDGLRCPHHSLQGLAVVGSTAAVPDSDAGREDALYGASVEVGEDVRRQTKLPEPSQEEEALTGRPHYFVGVE